MMYTIANALLVQALTGAAIDSTIVQGILCFVRMQEVVYGYRYLMIGYAIMLLFLFLWLSYMTGPMNRKQNHQDSMRADEL